MLTHLNTGTEGTSSTEQRSWPGSYLASTSPGRILQEQLGLALGARQTTSGEHNSTPCISACSTARVRVMSIETRNSASTLLLKCKSLSQHTSTDCANPSRVVGSFPLKNSLFLTPQQNLRWYLNSANRVYCGVPANSRHTSLHAHCYRRQANTGCEIATLQHCLLSHPTQGQV